jgi:hypothetical protein
MFHLLLYNIPLPLRPLPLIHIPPLEVEYACCIVVLQGIQCLVMITRLRPLTVFKFDGMFVDLHVHTSHS